MLNVWKQLDIRKTANTSQRTQQFESNMLFWWNDHVMNGF